MGDKVESRLEEANATSLGESPAPGAFDDRHGDSSAPLDYDSHLHGQSSSREVASEGIVMPSVEGPESGSATAPGKLGPI